MNHTAEMSRGNIVGRGLLYILTASIIFRSSVYVVMYTCTNHSWR